MAPNLVTLIGFVAQIISYLIIAYYAPYMEGDVPRWAFLLATVCLFWYQTMDAIDGKQARRTGTSSPLGELFDHGCDALTTVFMGLTLACTLQVGTGIHLMIVLLLSFLVFFMAQWEEYHTDLMDLGYFGVIEIHLTTMGLYMTSYFYSPMFWYNTVEIMGYNVQYNFFPIFLMSLGCALTCLKNLITVIKISDDFIQSFRQLLPMILLSVGSTSYALNSPSRVLDNYPHLYMCLVGFIFAYLTGRIVVCRVCKEVFPSFHPILMGFLIANAGLHFGLFDYIPENYYLFGYAIFVFVHYIHFALNIIKQMCNHLDIYCLKIKVKDQ
eukprot:TRINITY_DN45_c5_g1_i1.p1 TRINITY_DN45_c5_g1~~TRINITY_DN45_c5_g1_i1.p1  ORF type:complete len:326 (-),score=61.09 TRINITY_DN45_c5_g1_i1:131-1108(-)